MSKKYWNEEIETISREELEKYQLEKIKEQVKAAYDKSPYYRKSFDEAGVKPEDIKTLDDLRKQEYNMLVLPSQLATGEYIDIRLALPTGQDYVVLGKKKVLGTICLILLIALAS